MGLETALWLLVVTSAELYAEENHGVKYQYYKDTINEYHVDDAATIYRAYKDQYIEFKWEF